MKIKGKTGDLQKKKIFAEIRKLYLAEIENSSGFSAQKQVISKKRKKKVFTEIRNRKFKQFFRPKTVNFYLPPTSAKISMGGRLNLNGGDAQSRYNLSTGYT